MSLLDYCDSEIQKFMADLHTEFNREYPADLVELARAILKDNPTSLPSFI